MRFVAVVLLVRFAERLDHGRHKPVEQFERGLERAASRSLPRFGDRGQNRAAEQAESGHGLAQRRLGQIYDSGSPAVKHDYQASLKWYQKAREQGVPIPKPIQRGPAP